MNAKRTHVVLSDQLLKDIDKLVGGRKRGDTLVGTLRQTYGPDFAPGVRSDMRLDTLIDRTGAESLNELLRDRQRSDVSNAVADKELMRRRQIAALKAADGAWKDKDHPELKGGSAKRVRKLRQESERRFQKLAAR